MQNSRREFVKKTAMVTVGFAFGGIATGFSAKSYAKIIGSMIGGIQETQEMLDYCAANNIYSDVEMIAMKVINVVYDRILKSDVKYRFVIDMKTL